VQIANELGVSLDGGKDSLSMAAKAKSYQSNQHEMVKSPGTLVMSGYVNCVDVTKVVTPNIKFPGKSSLIYIDFHDFTKCRMGGSSLGQVYNQIGNESPDFTNVDYFKKIYSVVQKLILAGKIASGHDRSDGGLIVTLLEMAFSGDCGFDIEIESHENVNPLEFFFSEELGLVVEISEKFLEEVQKEFQLEKISYINLGKSTVEKTVKIQWKSKNTPEKTIILADDMCQLRDIWCETSFQLENYQTNPKCVEQEQKITTNKTFPPYYFSLKFPTDILPSNQNLTLQTKLLSNQNRHVAIIREEGSNGDREMTSAFHLSGFQCWDVTMSDLLNERITLDQFDGVAFVGGFSYADVMDSSKGWAAKILFSEKILKQFKINTISEEKSHLTTKPTETVPTIHVSITN